MARSAKRAQSSAADGVVGIASSTAPAFGRKYLVVIRSQVQTGRLPSIEVARGRDGTASRAGSASVGDVLVEGGGASDRWLVDLLVLVDIVDRSIAGHCALEGTLGRTLAVTGVLLDVVLNEWVASPSVDTGEDCSSGVSGATVEGDFPILKSVLYVLSPN